MNPNPANIPPDPPKYTPIDNKDHAVYRALEGTATFGATHAATFPAGSQGATDSPPKPLLEEIGKPQLTPGVPASPATGSKAALIDEVPEDLVAIAGTAETIARKESGFDASFQLGANTQCDTLADAKTFLKKLEDNALVAKWQTASHIERAPRRRDDTGNDTPPAPPVP